MWLALVLLVISPNKVEIWEAVITLLFFPLLIIIAYLADKDFCINRKKRQEVEFTTIGLSECRFDLVSVGDGDIRGVDLEWK